MDNDIVAEAEALAAAHPELDHDAVTSAFEFIAWEDEENWPRPYGEAERHAHAIVTTFLAHTGVASIGGVALEQSEASRQGLLEQAGIVMVRAEGDPDAALVALVPVLTLFELLTDYGMALSVSGRGGSVLDRHLGYVPQRETDDVALGAWLGRAR